MTNMIDKTVTSKYQPKSTNVIWVDTSLNPPVEKHFVNGKWKSMGGGVSDYSDIKNKPTINGVELDGNKTSQDLGVYSKPSSGIPQSDLSSDVQSQLNKHFKGWYDTLEELKAAHTAIDGDSAYVKDASPATTWSIYVYDSTASSDNYWADSGTDADTSKVQTFASGEEVNEVHIVNDLTTGGATDVLSAEQGKTLNSMVKDLEDTVNGGEEIQTVTKFKTLTGKRIPSNGSAWTGSGATGFNIDYFEVTPEKTFHLLVPKMSNQYTAVYSFGTREQNQTALPSPVVKGPVTNAEYDIVIPEGITVMFVCYEAASGSPTLTTTIQTTGIAEQIPEILNDIDDLDESVESILPRLDDVEDDVEDLKNIVDEKIEYETISPINSVNGLRLSSVVITDTTDIATNCKVESFNVNPGEEYKVVIERHDGNNYNHLIATNSDKVARVSNGVSIASFGYTAPVSEETEYTVTIPSGMYALYVCSDKNYPITVSLKKIIKSIDERVDDIEERLDDALVEHVDVILPENIDVVAGETLMLYYRNVVRVPNIDNYYVKASCVKAEYQQHCVVVKTNNDMVGNSYPLTINIIDKDLNTIGSGQTNIRVISKLSNPSSMTNILLVGSSILTSGTVTNELVRRFTDTSGTSGSRSNPKGLGLTNISFVGRKHGFAYTDVNQEAVGGASFYKRYGQNISPQVRFYVTNVDSCSSGAVYKDSGNHTYTVNESNFESGGDGNILCNEGTTPSASSGYLTRVSGEGDDTIEYTSYIIESGNPFWNTTTNQLDFATYANDYCNGSIDVMVVMMAGNDRGYAPIDTLFTDMIKPFARQLHSDFPNCKFVIGINSQPSTKGGGNTRYDYHNWYCDYAQRAYAMMKETEFEDYVSVAHTMQTFDAANMYPIKKVLVANRVNKTEDYCSNFVHPTGTGGQFVIGDDEGGCLCYADAIYSQITKVLQ